MMPLGVQDRRPAAASRLLWDGGELSAGGAENVEHGACAARSRPAYEQCAQLQQLDREIDEAPAGGSRARSMIAKPEDADRTDGRAAGHLRSAG